MPGVTHSFEGTAEMTGAELAERFFDAANTRDWDAIASIHTSDHDYHDPQGSKPAPGGRAMAEHLKFYVDALEGHWTVNQIVDAGEHVTARWTGSGRHSSDLIGVPATGTEFAVDAISMMRIHDGKIAEHWCVWDTAGLMQQIGVLPA